MSALIIDLGWDYATLTSFDREMAYVARDVLRSEYGERTSGNAKRVMGYRGFGSEGLFYGVKHQLKSGQWQEHHMVQLWGSNTEERMMIFSDHVPDIQCTRLDLQVTVLTKIDEPLRTTFDKAREGGLNVTLRESDTATVSFGSRQSNRYIRMYEKTGKDAQPYLTQQEKSEGFRVIRWEIEYKDILAGRGFLDILSEKADMKLLLTGEIGRKYIETKLMYALLEALTQDMQQDEAYHLRGQRKQTDAYTFFKETIVPWLLKRRDKLSGSELEECEAWIQSHFLLD